jgi:hypothetical protein
MWKAGPALLLVQAQGWLPVAQPARLPVHPEAPPAHSNWRGRWLHRTRL